MARVRQTLVLVALALVGSCAPPPSPKVESPPEKSPSQSSPEAAKTGEALPPPLPETTTAPTGGSGQKYLLRIKETPGNKWNYTFSVDTFADPRGIKADDPRKKDLKEYTEAKVKGRVEMTVLSVKDGVTTFNKRGFVTEAVATGVWKDQAAEMLKQKPDENNYRWDDRMRNIDIAAGKYYDIMTNCLHGLLPKEPVQIGSSWEYVPLPDLKKAAKAKCSRIEKVAGTDTLRIDVVIPPGQPNETDILTVWLDPTNGRFLKVTLDSVGSDRGLKSENHMLQTIAK